MRREWENVFYTVSRSRTGMQGLLHRKAKHERIKNILKGRYYPDPE